MCACGAETSETGGPSRVASPPTTQDEDELVERLAELRDLGYVDFSPEVADASEGSGVTIWDRERAGEGYNLYCSRTAPEAYLMDMSGEVVHRWSYPDRKNVTWSHVLLREGGELVVLVKFQSLLRLDRDSARVWKRPLLVHHDVAPGPDGSFVVLAREIRPHRGVRVAFPAIAWIGARGRETARWSAADHLAELRRGMDDRAFLDTLLDDIEAGDRTEELVVDDVRPYDYFHANTISLLPENALGRTDARFRPGNLLLCFRNVDQILVLDREHHGVVWSWGADELEWPHHPTMLPSGRLLVFDNGKRRGHTRVLELEPASGEIVWEYVGNPPETFFSLTKGSAQRLSNGNTLVCEGDAGRAFEVTRAGEIVWEWRNPQMDEGHRAAVYRMTRVPPEAAAFLASGGPR